MIAISIINQLKYGLMHPNAAYDHFFKAIKISGLTSRSVREVNCYFNELKSIKLYEYVQKHIAPYENLQLGTMLSPLKAPIVYVICRCIRPNVVVETGTASGVSSTFILQALERNKRGTLYSIDYPLDPHGAVLPSGKRTGWLIPDELRYRWELIVGKSSEKLKALLDELGEVDVFLHDSEHTYENMMFEFKTIWPYLKAGGIILSDDVTWNDAFSDFCQEVKPSYVTTFNALGALRK